MPRSRKLIIGLGGAAIVIALLAVYLQPTPVDVSTALVREGAMESIVSGDGRTRVRERFVVRSPVSGQLDRVTLREGTLVRVGDVVARIRPLPLDPLLSAQGRAALDAALARARDADASARAASTALANARRELERTRTLHAAGALAPRDVERDELAVRTAEAQDVAAHERTEVAAADVRQARAALLSQTGGPSADVLVRSPATGRVLLVHDQSERVVAASTPIIEIGDPASLEIVVDVLSSEAESIRAGDTGRLGVSRGAGGESERAPLAGRVRLVEPSGFTKVSALGVDEQRVNVILDPTATPAWGDGYRVDVAIVTWRAEHVILAPVSALVTTGTGGEWRVYVVDGERVHARQVRAGHVNGSVAEIVAGLRAGERVVVFPSDQVVDGARVMEHRTAP